MGLNIINDNLVNANVRVKYTGASKSFPNNTVPIDFDTSVFNEGFETITGGEFTIPADGQYQIQLAIELTGSSNGACAIYVDGVEADVGGSAQNLARHRCSSILDLTKGQTVSGRFPNTSTTSSSANLNYLAITRISQYSAGSPAGFGLATETKAGLLPAVSDMSDSLATQLGYKYYTDGENGLTLSGSNNYSTLSSWVRPIKMSDEKWMLEFNINFDMDDSITSGSVTISGIDSDRDWQNINVLTLSQNANWTNWARFGGANSLDFQFNTGVVGNMTTYGKILLTSKPTWAY